MYLLNRLLCKIRIMSIIWDVYVLSINEHDWISISSLSEVQSTKFKNLKHNVRKTIICIRTILRKFFTLSTTNYIKYAKSRLNAHVNKEIEKRESWRNEIWNSMNTLITSVISDVCKAIFSAPLSRTIGSFCDIIVCVGTKL